MKGTSVPSNLLRVPNVPCGVERLSGRGYKYAIVGFLMYRVELKVLLGGDPEFEVVEFLMYRVELKDTKIGSSASFCILVPNVPCGVESLIL